MQGDNPTTLNALTSERSRAAASEEAFRALTQDLAQAKATIFDSVPPLMAVAGVGALGAAWRRRARRVAPPAFGLGSVRVGCPSSFSVGVKTRGFRIERPSRSRKVSA